MKKIIFYFILILLALGICAALVTAFFHSYSVVILKRRPQAAFVDFVKKATLQQIDKNYELPDMKKGDQMDERRPHPYCGYKTQAGVTVREGFYTNGLGQRSPALGLKGPGVVRIAMIGGSVAWDGTVNDKTIIGVLARLLNEQGIKTEYINAAVVSSISNQELGVLVHDILDLQVDLLISFDGNNDITQPLYFNGRIGWPPFRWDTITKAPEHSERLRQMAPAYYPPLQPLYGRLTPPQFSVIVQNYFNNINKFATISRAFNIKYLAVLQPLRDFDPAQCGRARELPAEKIFYCVASPAFAQLDREGRAGGVFLSLGDFLSGHRDLFTDECHFNDQANELVAAKLLEVIKARRLLPGVR